MSTDIQTRAERVKLLLMDVDGVMTDSKLYNVPGPDGTIFETKAFEAQDGIALQWLSWNGIRTGLISGRVSPATEERARQCKFTYIYQGHIEKIPILEKIMADCGLTSGQVAYIGDDLTDAVVMRRVGLAIATANAPRSAHRPLRDRTRGSQGAVRDVYELLKAGATRALLKKYEIE
jgi:3-deoxy-D-manno-octulosonate 8-phosphate phosphatase (KDO 8-P phosphatase)